MREALITGSETFGRYITNPSKWLALSVDGKVIADHRIHTLVFPSTVRLPEGMENAGTTIVKKAQEVGAHVIISFGMASEVKGFRLERSATNWIYNEKYCSPDENNHPLDPTRPEKEHLQIDLSPWDREKIQSLFVRENIPFDPKVSDDPGQYSCNGWIYRTLRAMQEQDSTIPYLFVHTACTEEAIELIPDFDRVNKILIKKEDTIKALEIILQSYNG
jgi:pyrrolidone-carboxylate peptidase